MTVEIADYLNIARRRMLVLILVPVLAAGLAVGYVLLNPREHTASAYVTAPSLVGADYGTVYEGSQGTENFVTDFTAAATSPGVVNAVVDQIGQSAAEITESVAVTRVGESSTVKVTYTGTQPAQGTRIASSIAGQSLRSMFGPSVRLAEQRVEAAKKAMAEADQAVSDFEAEHGTPAVENTEYRILLAQQRAAQQSLTDAFANLSQAKAALSAVQRDGVVRTPPVEMEPLAPLLLSRVLLAAGSGLLLAVGLVVLLELVFPGRVPVLRPGAGRGDSAHVPAETRT